MKRVLVPLALALVWLSLYTPAAGATNECDGLLVCVSVPGPWVAIPAPTRTTRAPTVSYLLRCPSRYVVGGLDAELSHRAIELAFLGTLGSPVNPGITTSRAAVFVGTYAGATSEPTSFRPVIGCIPTSGGGRETTGRRLSPSAFPPGKPVARRVLTVRLRAGRTLRVVHGCARGERLLASSHAVGFYRSSAPDPGLIRSVIVTRAERAGRIVVRVRTLPSLGRTRAEVQIHAICGARKR